MAYLPLKALLWLIFHYFFPRIPFIAVFSKCNNNSLYHSINVLEITTTKVTVIRGIDMDTNKQKYRIKNTIKEDE
jgi:hypothetical protein